MGKVAVMGAGSWGTVYATICADAGADVVLWARRQEVADEVDGDHRNRAYLGEQPLPAALRATADAEEALRGADIVVLAIPSQALRACLLDWRAVAPRASVYASLIKGLEAGTRQRPSEVVREVLDLPGDQVVAVSGPHFAAECARRMPSATVVGGSAPDVVERVQAHSHTDYFRVYTNLDLVGVEIGGAVKNAIAVAAGVSDGMGYGDNTKAMLVTRGLAEMTRLGVALGGDSLTFSGLAGTGDLVMTCMSRQSRNRHVGEQLGRGQSLEEITGETRMVAEGVHSAPALAELARIHGVEMPIVEHVVKVVHEGMDPAAVASVMMGRAPKPEFHGLQLGREGVS